MKSPFSAQARAWIYVLSLIISAAAAVIGPLSLALDWGDEWAALAVTAVGVLGTITNTLAKANLPAAGESTGVTITSDDPVAVAEDTPAA